MTAGRESTQNIGFLAEEVPARPRLLLDEARAHEGEEQAPGGGLVETALLDDVAQLCAALGFPSDERQQPQGPIHALGPWQIIGRELSIIHIADPPEVHI